MSTFPIQQVRWENRDLLRLTPGLECCFQHIVKLQGLPGTKNFYLETESGVQVGVWQVLPSSLVEHSDDKDSDWWDAQLNDGRWIGPDQELF